MVTEMLLIEVFEKERFCLASFLFLILKFQRPFQKSEGTYQCLIMDPCTIDVDIQEQVGILQIR